jgi:phenylalanyl-tRNA synthetase beta chain
VHPLVARAWEIERTLAAFAIDLGKVAAAAPAVTTYADLTSFPSLRQDLAVVVAAGVPAARVLETVRRAAGELLGGVSVFDVYSGDQIGAGRVSLALHLEFRAADRTLTDEDVAPVRDRIVAALQEELGGELRG